ncbi:amidohydrolase family protein [Nocardioides humilatus]|nr:amidohydrolase family protein [Nocardioides humilatus]
MTQVLAGVVPGIIDTHIHQWDPFTTPREASKLAPLYKRAPKLLDRVAPIILAKGVWQMVRTAQYAAQPYLPVDYAADVAGTVETVGVPVQSAVHVQCGWHSDDQSEETAWLDGLPFGKGGNPGLAAIVGTDDPRDPDFATMLDRHAAASSRFRGIRFMTTWHPDKHVLNWIDEPGVMTSPAFLKGFAHLAERGLTYDAYVYSDQIHEVAALAKEYPDATIVLDHFAPPVGVLGPMGRATGRDAAARADMLARWKDNLALLSEHTNVVAKHSGLAFPMLGWSERVSGDEVAEKVAPLVQHQTEVFGEDRLMWGSNYPMDKAICPYPEIVRALADLLAPAGPDLLRKVFRDNAIRVYNL